MFLLANFCVAHLLVKRGVTIKYIKYSEDEKFSLELEFAIILVVFHVFDPKHSHEIIK